MESEKHKNYALPIIVMIFLFGMISFVTNLASPMGDILKYQFQVPMESRNGQDLSSHHV